MAKNIINVTESKSEADEMTRSLNRHFIKNNIKREAYTTTVSEGYVRTLTRKGYPIAKKNYGVAVRDK